MIPTMLGVTPKRLFSMVLVGGIFYVALQYVPALFYAYEFEDFVRDEVKFAPLRETTDPKHLREHILDQARQYRMIVDKESVQVTNTRDRDRGINVLTVDVNYRMPVDLYYFIHELPFHSHVSTAY